MSDLPPTLDLPGTESATLEEWTSNDAFKVQDALSIARGDPEYTFYDGPPFATGLPHYGHILAGTIKDVVTRFACGRGFRVERRAGWDCHGLPVEYEIDQMLNITHREQVLEMGIDKYNDTCRSIVTRYTSEWVSTVTRLGRWIDFENDYKTMDVSFMESVWWVFGQLHAKGLVYRGYKVMPYSTACGTVLSNFEAGLNYKEVRDPAVTISFPIASEGWENVELTAWTTTPWTLPSNLALCVHPELVYVVVKDVVKNKTYVCAESRLCQLFPAMNSKKYKPKDAHKHYEIVKKCVGKDLVGLTYTPVFQYFKDHSSSSRFWKVLSDTYVTDDSGTGIVHQAPAFGEDDYRVCLKHGVIKKGEEIVCPVDVNGLFTDEVPEVKGVHVKKADETLIKLLKESNRLVQKDNLSHQYPYCWRSDTPLIYKAVPSWFIRVEDIRDKIIENNKKTYWVPSAVGEGRFHAWLRDARDWAVSRNRFWGTPMPIWASENFDEIVCVDSIDRLEELSGVRVKDLHREFIDDLTIPSQKNPGTVLRRVDEVFDCWFESGSMPYAQKHYPFENKEQFEAGFPADFIAEGLDQTRGWFYTLMVLSTALFDKPAFKNLICNGLVLAADGKKMSKRLKNYPDPKIIVNKYGADALRMYLINSPVVRAESLRFQEAGVLGVVKEVFLPWYNAFRFFMQNVERWSTSQSSTVFVPSIEKVKSSKNPTDIWIGAATQGLIKYVHQEMEAYRLYTVMPALVRYVTQLTNWYVRLNRDRLKGSEGEDDAETGLQVLFDVLLDVTRIMAPFTPFITEYFYQHLRKMLPSYSERVDGGGTSNPVLPGKSDSVHFLKLPSYDASRLNEDAVASMEMLQTVVELGRNVREKRNISLRTPIKNVTVVMRSPSPAVVAGINESLRGYILSELNAWDLNVVPKDEEHQWVKLSLQPNLKKLGKKLGKNMKMVKEHITNMSHADAISCMENGELKIGEIVIDAKTELLSKLAFAKEEDHWEATESATGDVVVAVDCTQDEAIISAGTTREFIGAVQQLRKSAGLTLADSVEVFYKEGSGLSTTERAISLNVPMVEAKLRGIVPLPTQFAPAWNVEISKTAVEIGGSPVEVSICRPSVAAKEDVSPELCSYFSTLCVSDVEEKETINVVIDGKKFSLKNGTDFWCSTTDKLRSLKKLSYL
mmetsp:Transcript_3680/g.6815  ORF Transcript_3680/g.6815 Transcript_3680/m.6815 type:complete len:1171 (-) Transcript_3680:166-3678(-)